MTQRDYKAVLQRWPEKCPDGNDHTAMADRDLTPNTVDSLLMKNGVPEASVNGITVKACSRCQQFYYEGLK